MEITNIYSKMVTNRALKQYEWRGGDNGGRQIIPDRNSVTKERGLVARRGTKWELQRVPSTQGRHWERVLASAGRASEESRWTKSSHKAPQFSWLPSGLLVHLLSFFTQSLKILQEKLSQKPPGPRIKISGYVYTFSKRFLFEVSTRIVPQSGDPVHTDVDWSKDLCLHLKTTASAHWLFCVDGDGLASSSYRIFLVLYVYMSFFSIASRACARRRSVRSLRIMEAGDKRNAPKPKQSET